MPITTMWLSRSSGASSSCSRSICSTISPVVRLRVDAVEAAGAEHAAHAAADLRADADRAAHFVAEQHALDLPAVGQREQQLLRAVVGLRVPGDLRGPQREVAASSSRKRLRQVGHLAKSRARCSNSHRRTCPTRYAPCPRSLSQGVSCSSIEFSRCGTIRIDLRWTRISTEH